MLKIFKLLTFINIIVLFTSCSFNNPGGFFEDETVNLEKKLLEKNSKLVFSETKKFQEEIVGKIAKVVEKPIIVKNWTQSNLQSSNHIPHLSYENKKQLVFKSKKLGKNKFDLSNLFFEPLLLNNKIFFYDTSGNIYNFSLTENDLVWKFNFYKKRYKNIPIKIKLQIIDNSLIISDNLGYVYCLKIKSGKLKWAKNYGVPFRSNIKADNENIFVLNQDNKFYIINKEDGNLDLNFETFPSFLKSKRETNISLDSANNNVYFITSSGELYSVNYRTKNINWLSSLSGTKLEGSDLFYSSPIVFKDDKIIFSSSFSTYSVNSKNGQINWELPFSTYLRPIVSKNFIILSSKNGFVVNVDLKSGKVIWSKDIYGKNKKLTKEKIGEINSITFISEQVLATTTKGFFLFIDYKDGKIINYTKASRGGFFSNPIVVNNKIHVIDKKFRVLIFN